MALLGKNFGPAHGGIFTEVSSILQAGPSDDFLVIPNDGFVLEAAYERLGPDLLLSDRSTDGNRAVVVKDLSLIHI